MVTTKDTVWLISLLIYVIVGTVEATILEQHAMIEYLLHKVEALERNQEECSSYQRKMFLELKYVKNKLQDAERRISELEAIVYNTGSDEYSEHLSVTMESQPAHKPTNKTGTNVIKEHNIGSTPDLKRMNSRKSGIVERDGITTEHIGFCATLYKGEVPVHASEIILFDNVLQNEGNGFNKQTGIFTCPLSGIYFFSLSILVQPGSAIDVYIIVNGQIIAKSYAYGVNYSDQGSISSIVRCEAGQNVWIGVYGGTQLYGGLYTSFSGFFLWGDPKGSR
ncbi:hypothetical protein ACJMK2_029034 [Sinanodonta woodiana]|uniref:C1q domain-containing protein n=1 Tax=Sinanodonta woodiana TaxID=1069815 RepID=A0ABD3X8Y4_SINWO